MALHSPTFAAQSAVGRNVIHSWAVDDITAVSRYLNRLSDLFFVMARLLNSGDEPQWRGLS